MSSSLPVLDSSPAYDLVASLLVLGGGIPPGRWRTWAGKTRATFDAVALRRLRMWFGGNNPVGGASVALVPLLAERHSADALIATLLALPQGDFLRLAVTAGFIAPEAPLAAGDLLSLRDAPAAARSYVDRYLRLTGRAQSHLLWILNDPEAARAELVEIMRRHLTGPFAEVESTIRDERERATQRLGELLANEQTIDPPWLRKLRNLQGFSPVVVASSAFTPSSSAYYHEIGRSLFDDADYEPYVLMMSNGLILGAARPGRPVANASFRGQRASTHDLIERSAMLFGLLSDPTRLRMLHLLVARPHYGQEIASALDISGATTAHHTNELMKAGIVTIERRAHRTYFVLRTASLAHELRASLDFLLATDNTASSDVEDGKDDENEPVL